MILEESSVTLDIRDEFTSNILSRKINTSAPHVPTMFVTSFSLTL